MWKSGRLQELLLEQRALVRFPNPLAPPKSSEAGNYTYIHVPVEMIVSLGLSTFIDIFFNWVFIENRLTEVMLKAYFLVLTLLSWAAFWRDLRSHENPTIWAYSWKLVCAPSAFSPAVRQSWIARCFALERPAGWFIVNETEKYMGWFKARVKRFSKREKPGFPFEKCAMGILLMATKVWGREGRCCRCQGMVVLAENFSFIFVTYL